MEIFSSLKDNKIFRHFKLSYMNFVKFFYTESKLTDLRLHTYFIWVGTHFEALNLGYCLGAAAETS